MFSKKVIGRYDFHFGEGSDETLSRHHRSYEAGFLTCIPYGDGNEDVSNAIANTFYSNYVRKYPHFADFLVWIDVLCREKGVPEYSVDYFLFVTPGSIAA